MLSIRLIKPRKTNSVNLMFFKNIYRIDCVGFESFNFNQSIQKRFHDYRNKLYPVITQALVYTDWSIISQKVTRIVPDCEVFLSAFREFVCTSLYKSFPGLFLSSFGIVQKKINS